MGTLADHFNVRSKRCNVGPRSVSRQRRHTLDQSKSKARPIAKGKPEGLRLWGEISCTACLVGVERQDPQAESAKPDYHAVKVHTTRDELRQDFREVHGTNDRAIAERLANALVAGLTAKIGEER
jgi:hypothetical protein